jgi:nucleoside-diphosphate-sugar epimerase
MVVLAGATPATGGALEDNARIADACLAAAQAAGIGRVLLASSSAVYGADPAGRPFAEDAPPRPLSDYGRAKLAMEAVAAPWRQAGIAVTALRIGNVAGADALLAGRAGAGAAPVGIDAFADGLGPLRSYIGPRDMAAVLADLALHPGPLPEVLNLAALRPVRMMALATAAGLDWRPVPAPPAARQVITLDCARLAALCPDSPGPGDAAAMVAQWKAVPHA